MNDDVSCPGKEVTVGVSYGSLMRNESSNRALKQNGSLNACRTLEPTILGKL